MQKDIAMNDKIESEPRRQFLVLLEKIADQLVRLFMRHNILIPEMEKMVRRVGVRAAVEDPDFAIDGREEKYQQTYSRAAVVTGLTRQEVSQVAAREVVDAPLDGGELNRLFRILTAWRADDGYQDVEGKPIDLPLRGPPPSLHQLCHKYGRNTPTRAIADALVRNGNVEWIGGSDERRQDKQLRYIHPVVTSEVASAQGMAIVTQHCSDYMHSLRVLLDPDKRVTPRFRQGYFNDIDVDFADDAEALVREEMQEFTIRCTEGLKKFRAAPGKPTVRIGAGSYSFRDAPLFLKIDPDTPVRETVKKRHSSGDD